MTEETPKGFEEIFGANGDRYHTNWGVKWLYLKGYWISEILGDVEGYPDDFKVGTFLVVRAGRPSQIIDETKSMQAAKTSMLIHWEEIGSKEPTL